MKKLLVMYASKAGFTAKIAQAISQRLVPRLRFEMEWRDPAQPTTRNDV